MKVAVLTQPLGANYGGMIQAFALQQVLKNLGHQVVTIDRRELEPSFYERILFYGSRIIKKMMGRRNAPIFIESHYKHMYKNTRAFIAKNLVTSHTIYSTDEMKQYFDKEAFDAVVVGSDQVWRVDYSPNIFEFFLDFLENTQIKKLSYAASFGRSKWVMNNDDTKRCAELAKTFDNVSVREQEAVDLCKEYLGIDSTWVCDPTLLVPKAKYLKLIEDYEGVVKGDLFYYLLDNSGSKQDAIVKIADKLSMETYTCYPKRKHYDTQGTDMNEYVFPPVEQWLSSFKDAKLIITDSFHGVVFSLIFQKPFLVFINEERGASRFYSLMKIANFESRLIKNENDLELILTDENLLHPVAVDEKFIEQSRAFLYSNIK